MINLISDTVTQPTRAMREVMMNAEVGDDVFGQDPSINALESRVAQMFNKEAALFCPSGTMTNQLAIKLHTQPLDEVICEKGSHIYQYETGAYAFHSGVAMNLIEGKFGKITKEQVAASIRPEADWLPKSRLVVLENTCNKGGGTIYTLEEVKPIQQLCKEKGLSLHLDGARLFNALVETGESTEEWGTAFDSISLCLSKGLGAPVGSLLIGNTAFIKRARRLRKVFGGGMRQAGFLAAAGQYALDHHVDRLKEDNQRARELGHVLEEMPYVAALRPVQTNIVIFDLTDDYTAESFLSTLEAKGILAVPFGPQTIRFVTHLDFTEEMLEKTKTALKGL